MRRRTTPRWVKQSLALYVPAVVGSAVAQMFPHPIEAGVAIGVGGVLGMAVLVLLVWANG